MLSRLQSTVTGLPRFFVIYIIEIYKYIMSIYIKDMSVLKAAIRAILWAKQ